MEKYSDREQQEILKYLELLRGEINAKLDEYTDFGARCPKYLSDPMRYSLLSSGKRSGSGPF